MAIFVNDTFTDSNGTDLASHTGETGATWVEHSSYASGAFTIHSNQVYCSTVTALYYASGSPASAEYDIEVPVTKISPNSGRKLGIAARIDTGANTHYDAQIFEADTLRIFKTVAGVNTQLAENAAFGVGTSTLKFEIRDAAKKLYVNSVEQLSTADNAITAAGKVGLFGLGTAATTTTGFHADSFAATDATVVADRYDFGTEPANTAAGATMAAVTVRAEDAGGNLDTSYTGTVTIAINTNPGGGALSGTLAKAAVAGVATFSDLSINKFGVGYDFIATGSLTSTTSNTFNITATTFDFGTEPGNTVENATMASFTVRAEDPFGTLDTTYVGSITIAIDANPGSGTLSGTLTRAAVSGVSTFNDISINNPGTGYTLIATGSLTSTTSATFNITLLPADHLAFGQQPSSVQVLAVMAPAVTVRALNSENALDTNYAANIVIALQVGASTLGGTLTRAAAGGIATFDDLTLSVVEINDILRATSGALTLVDSGAFNVTAGAPTIRAMRSVRRRGR
jgi:hypothetical protein